MPFFNKFTAKSGLKPEYILVGLGNPDRKYEKTRHNIGFMAVDYIADKCGAKINRSKYDSLNTVVEINGKNVMLMKPQTYMNRSGIAVSAAVNFYKIPVENIIAVSDDVNFETGSVRIRIKGSDGGQKGLRSLINMLDSDEFPRIRLGAGVKPEHYDISDWVLSRLTPGEMKTLDGVFDSVHSAVGLIAEGKIDLAMSKYNQTM